MQLLSLMMGAKLPGVLKQGIATIRSGIGQCLTNEFKSTSVIIRGAFFYSLLSN
jgi:hypothetical protein